jgi:formylglycine-generating enzyme required for sulfatase activity
MAVSPPSEIAELVAKLSSPIYKERQASTKALKMIGAPAMAFLRTAMNTGPDLETRVRARQLMEEIGDKNFVLRGGSYSVLPWTARAAVRNYNLPAHCNANYGVRVAITAAGR